MTEVETKRTLTYEGHEIEMPNYLYGDLPKVRLVQSFLNNLLEDNDEALEFFINQLKEEISRATKDDFKGFMEKVNRRNKGIIPWELQEKIMLHSIFENRLKQYE